MLPFLRGLFGPGVLEPIRLHVEAKRYLCYLEPHYEASLSEDSKRSLALQGAASMRARRWISPACRARRMRFG